MFARSPQCPPSFPAAVLGRHRTEEVATPGAADLPSPRVASPAPLACPQDSASVADRRIDLQGAARCYTSSPVSLPVARTVPAEARCPEARTHCSASRPHAHATALAPSFTLDVDEHRRFLSNDPETSTRVASARAFTTEFPASHASHRDLARRASSALARETASPLDAPDANGFDRPRAACARGPRARACPGARSDEGRGVRTRDPVRPCAAYAHQRSIL